MNRYAIVVGESASDETKRKLYAALLNKDGDGFDGGVECMEAVVYLNQSDVGVMTTDDGGYLGRTSRGEYYQPITVDDFFNMLDTIPYFPFFEHEAIDMTLGEVCKELGKNIRIVKEKDPDLTRVL